MFLAHKISIRIWIYEVSYELEDWSNDCWKCSYAITEINDFLTYIQIEN